MARPRRLVVPGLFHHITQRGNNGEQIFVTAGDRLFYLSLLRQHALEAQVSLAGFCLMSNHVHLIARPGDAGLSQWIQRAHSEYAKAFNERHGRTGHLWRNRFFSCTLEDSHVLNALRYVDLNPVRAGLVQSAVDWPWSSATAHVLGRPDVFRLLSMDWVEWREWPRDWGSVLETVEDNATRMEIRRHTFANRPMGSATFVEELEARSGRKLARREGGRPRIHYSAVS